MLRIYDLLLSQCVFVFQFHRSLAEVCSNMGGKIYHVRTICVHVCMTPLYMYVYLYIEHTRES